MFHKVIGRDFRLNDVILWIELVRTQHHQFGAAFKISLLRPYTLGNEEALAVGFADNAVMLAAVAQIDPDQSGQGDQNLISDPMSMPAALNASRHVGYDEGAQRHEWKTGELYNF